MKNKEPSHPMIKRSEIDNAPVLSMHPEDANYGAEEKEFMEMTFRFFLQQKLIHGKSPCEYGEEFVSSFHNCLKNYTPGRASFSSYFLQDVSWRILRTLTKEQENLSQLIWENEAEWGEESESTLFDNLLFSSSNGEDLYSSEDNPETACIRRDEVAELLQKVEVSFLSLRRDAQEVIAAWLTSLLFRVLGPIEAEVQNVKTYAFFRGRIWGMCLQKRGALSQKELAEELGVYESNISRSVCRFREILSGNHDPVPPMPTIKIA